MRCKRGPCEKEAEPLPRYGGCCSRECFDMVQYEEYGRDDMRQRILKIVEGMPQTLCTDRERMWSPYMKRMAWEYVKDELIRRIKEQIK